MEKAQRYAKFLMKAKSEVKSVIRAKLTLTSEFQGLPNANMGECEFRSEYNVQIQHPRMAC